MAISIRHQPSGLNARYQGPWADIPSYLAHTREMIGQACAASGRDHTAQRIEGNAPFVLQPEGTAGGQAGRRIRRGVLLVHGLSDSPYYMRHLGAQFQAEGFKALAVLLPGHGTCPGDLLDIAWQEWSRTVAFGVEQLAEEVDEVYLAGYSAGAVLCLRQSLLDERVRGLFLFSPALKVTRWAALADLHKLYSWAWPAGKWVDIRDDDDLYKYESFPKNAARQMHALIADLHRQMKGRTIRLPVFAAASADDHTVDSRATVSFMGQIESTQSKLVYYTRTPERCPDGISAGRIEIVNSVVPEQNILSFSHSSMLFPPEDPHYGRRGDYSNCLHYYLEGGERYVQCRRNGPEVLQGEIIPENLRQGVMRRLTYNPHFSRLQASLHNFIEKLP